jgi:anthranilate phosphoribosyltransferase
MPLTSTTQAQAALDADGLAFLPLTGLCPGMHSLLGLRSRLGVRNSAHSLVKLLNPFRGDAVLVAPATHPDFIDLMRNILLNRGQRGLLLRGTEGEPFPNAGASEFIHDGVVDVLFEAESLRALPNLPGATMWRRRRRIRRALDKQIPLPADRQPVGLPVVASGYARFQPGQGHRRRRGDRDQAGICTGYMACPLCAMPVDALKH